MSSFPGAAAVVFVSFLGVAALACSSADGVQAASGPPDVGAGAGGAAAHGGGGAGGEAGGAPMGGAGGVGEGGSAFVPAFVVDGPTDVGHPPAGTSYTLDPATGAGPAGATVGSPCATGDDCASLGEHAACFRGAAGGFCTLDCDLDGEGPSQICPTGALCFASLRADGGRLCLTTCADDGACDGGQRCSASLFTFNVDAGSALACLPTCADDAGCNADSSGLACDVGRGRCESPREVLGRVCATNADCAGLGPSGLCMRSERDASVSYCTVACDPEALDACALGGGNGGVLGPCVSGYAASPSGDDVPVCLGACDAEAQCQLASNNTCNDIPRLGAAACTVRCTTDADCIDGACDVPSGDCRSSAFFSARCASDSNCPLGLCVSDFHHGASHNCTSACVADAECPGGAVCVTSPVAQDAAGRPIAPGDGTGDQGFCAPACAQDSDCVDPTTTCLAPHDPPEIDFAGSGSASRPFCWR